TYFSTVTLTPNFSTLSLHDALPISEISRVSLDVNYAALLQHQPFLNAIDIRDAQVTLPLPEEADPKSAHAQIKSLHAHIYLGMRSEEHTSELQSRFDLVCRLLLEKK